MKNTNTNEYKRVIWKYLIEADYTENDDQTPLETVIFYERRLREELGHMKDQGYSRQEIATHWLQGLAINIDYTHYEIIQTAKKLHGVKSFTEDKEMLIVDSWFSHLAQKLIQLIDYVNSGKRELIEPIKTTKRKSKKLKYQSLWYSPRGYANEGSYLYGTIEEIDSLTDKLSGDVNANWQYVSRHYTLDAAIAKCRQLCRADHNSTPSHELCYIDYSHVNAEEPDDIDWP